MDDEEGNEYINITPIAGKSYPVLIRIQDCLIEIWVMCGEFTDGVLARTNGYVFARNRTVLGPLLRHRLYILFL